jgi:hypothetical protein
MLGLPELSYVLMLYVAVVILISGWVQGALGMGFPTIATPLIAAVSDMHTAVLLALIPCLATVITNIIRSGTPHVVFERFWWLPLYMLGGSWLGTRLFIHYPQFPFALLLAAIILFYLNLERLGRMQWPWMQRHQALVGAGLGFLAGVSEGTANISAPPLIIYLLGIGLTPMLMVPTMNLCFATGKATQLFTFVASGSVAPQFWLMTLPLAVIAVGASLHGITVRQRITDASYRRWLQRALFVMALILLVQYAYQWRG